jgi:catechol 2,3-dioxygenase-like lactoylglutathione lyase family enzyme
MAKTRVTRIRHVGLAAPNFEETVNYYSDAFGLKKTDHDSGIAFFAAEGSPEQYILRLRKSDEKRVDLVAFGVDDAATVDEFASSLAADGVRFVSEPGALNTPGGGYGFRFFDPDGNVIEISSDVAERPFRQIEEREAIPVKLSHVVLDTANVTVTQAFYEEKLGLLVSDWLGDGMCFMRCTPDQHNLAVFQRKDAAFNHFAVEMRGFDDFMRATGRVMKTGGVLRYGPGRHGPLALNTFSYFYDPNGHVGELITGLEQIPVEGGRPPRVIDPAVQKDEWGTARTIEPDAVPAAAKKPDTGHWQAPPI